MSRFMKWSQKEHSLGARIAATLPVGLIIIILIPYLLVVTCPSLDRRLGIAPFKPGMASIIPGGILVAVGLFFGLWSVSAQFEHGRGTPLPMMPTQGLLTSGPFRYCRNPMTLGTILIYLGLCISALTITGLALASCLIALLLLYLKRVEEKELAERFGEPYLAYKREVPFIFPRRPRQN